MGEQSFRLSSIAIIIDSVCIVGSVNDRKNLRQFGLVEYQNEQWYVKIISRGDCPCRISSYKRSKPGGVEDAPCQNAFLQVPKNRIFRKDGHKEESYRYVIQHVLKDVVDKTNGHKEEPWCYADSGILTCTTCKAYALSGITWCECVNLPSRSKTTRIQGIYLNKGPFLIWTCPKFLIVPIFDSCSICWQITISYYATM